MARQTLIALFVVTICVANHAFAQERGDKRLNQSPNAAANGQPRYRKSWAIVIGINYEGLPEKRRREVPQLNNAEADANAFADTLIDNFGYIENTKADNEKNLYRLIGKNADLKSIRRLLANVFLTSDTIKKDDSLLLYFSGHGSKYIKRDILKKGLLWPWDVDVNPSGGIDDSSCVELSYIRKQLGACNARHKLLVLDSCYSGEIFNGKTTRAASIHVDQIVPEAFSRNVIQAMASARDDQVAADSIRGKDGDTSRHSPFTTALLDCLRREIPAKVFGASYLASRVATKLHLGKTEQIPIDGRLDGNGEFYFFRTSPVPLPDMTNHVLQTLPGLHGRWWFEETPWLLPSLRVKSQLNFPTAVAASKPLPDSMVSPPADPFYGQVNVRAVHQRLREALDQHLNQLPISAEKERRIIGLLSETAITEFNEAEREKFLMWVDDYPDPHFRAVIYHRMKPNDRVDELYEDALKSYYGASSEDKMGLWRLCRADYGRYLFDTGNYNLAAGQLRNSRGKEPSAQSPPLFFVHTLIWESKAHMQKPDWRKALDTIKEAKGIADESLEPNHPLLAAVHDQYAWAYMDRWHLDQAITHFERAIQIRVNGSLGQDESLDELDLMTRVLIYHDRHGLAMAKRFQAKFSEAQTLYRQLCSQLLDELGKDYSPQHATILYGRLVNSLERLGDSFLFATPPVAAKAFDPYEQATKYANRNLSSESKARTVARLECKKTMTLTLIGEHRKADRTLQRMKETTLPKLVGKQREEIDHYLAVAEGVLALHTSEKVPCIPLEKLLQSKQHHAALARRPLEVLLFGADQLLKVQLSQPDLYQDNLTKNGGVLLTLISDKFVNRSNILYVRPYLDAGLRAYLNRPPEQHQLGELMRHTLRAKLGKLGAKLSRRITLSRDRTYLVFYLFENDGFAVLQRPLGTQEDSLEYFSFEFEVSELGNAELPSKLVKSFQETVKDGQIYVQWVDLVRRNFCREQIFRSKNFQTGNSSSSRNPSGNLPRM